jgi:hypothetical protein
MHAIKDKPVVVNGEIVIRPIMVVALTYDHRLLDGREAVTFLGEYFRSVLIAVVLLVFYECRFWICALCWALECCSFGLFGLSEVLLLFILRVAIIVLFHCISCTLFVLTY